MESTEISCIIGWLGLIVSFKIAPSIDDLDTQPLLSERLTYNCCKELQVWAGKIKLLFEVFPTFCHTWFPSRAWISNSEDEVVKFGTWI